MKETKVKIDREVMRYGGESPGPSLIVFGGVHGNEPAGIKALSLVKKMLDVEPITNPNFNFQGQIIGLIGNLPAYTAKVRYVQTDMNRMWTPEIVHTLSNTSDDLHDEAKELLDLLSYIKEYVEEKKPQELYILDLHTTSSYGGIFAIPSDDPKSIEIASNLYAPVILDIMDGIKGTTLHYFTKDIFQGVSTTALTFEGGQHDDPVSINRCIAAIVNCLRSIGCVTPEDVENIHDQILIEYAKDLPKVSRLIYKHHISGGDNFVMKPGYKNFDNITAGEHLADDKNGAILSPHTGKILMPLYQPKGEEGFYIIEPAD